MTQQESSGERFHSLPVLRLALKLSWYEADRLARRLLVLTLIFVLGTSVVAGLAPVLLKVIVDGLERDTPNGYGSALFYLVAAYAVSHLLTRVLGELRSTSYGRVDQRMQRLLSARLFKHVLSLPLRFHLDRKTGALSQTLTNGLFGYRLLLHHLMLTVLPVAFELVTMGTVLLILDHAVFLLIMAGSVLFYALAFSYGIKGIREPARAASSAHIDATAMLTDSILNYETVKCFGAEPQVQARFVDALHQTEDRWTAVLRQKMWNGFAVATVFALSLGISVYVAVKEVQQGSMSIGEFVLVGAYILQITRPLEMVGFALRDIAQGMAFIDKMAQLLTQKSEIEDIPPRKSLPEGIPDLKFEQVWYSYQPDRYILRDISFVVPAGKTVAVIGASGSGKSSLVRLLLRLVEPIAGRIYVSGVPISAIPRATLRSAIALVPQDIALFNDTIAYNIGFGKPNSSKADIVRAAKVAHIHDFVAELPDGYETIVGERGVRLSGGEKQRIAIARAIHKQPRILVFDEATSALDSKTEQAILHDFIRIVKTTTTLVIAHRLSTIVHAEEIIVLREGRVVEYGKHNELLKRNGDYALMWRTQQTQRSEERVRAFTV